MVRHGGVLAKVALDKRALNGFAVGGSRVDVVGGIDLQAVVAPTIDSRRAKAGADAVQGAKVRVCWDAGLV